MRPKKVEILTFEGCPNLAPALEHARRAILDAGVPAEVQVVRVENDPDAMRLRFLGSPTVRVDGVDVEPSAPSRDDYGLQCRVYSVGGRHDGAPPVDWIVAALR